MLHQLTEYMSAFLSAGMNSELFAGGIALGLIGAGAGLVGLYGRRLWAFALRRLSVTVTLDNRSPAYGHFMLWLEQTGALAHARRQHVTARARGAQGEAWLPATGTHWFRQGARLCVLAREISEKARSGGYNGTPLESVTLTLFGGGFATLRGWIAEGARQAEEAARRGPALYVMRRDYWEHLGEVNRRSLNTVLCDDDRLGRLLDDMRWFYGAADWYAERGVPWRRGYLLHGPPGTGKSSVVRALASELGLDLAVLDIGQQGLSDDGLIEALSTAPARAILLIEDIDAIFTARDSGAREAAVSFSGLLNAIDGVAAQEGRALVMTTNHPERLDPALIRAGRADRHVELGLVGSETAAQLFARFFPERADLAGVFRDALGDVRLAPATVQGWLLEHLDDPARAARAEGLLPDAPAAMAAE